ncbi:MAG: glycoside hydrolase family 99-like domain-containing protein [Verrucomicrobia bacterium]|nr:glycoside hydrolase family 99-like domain-containing protein [Verrucomicrobiota bacterium]
MNVFKTPLRLRDFRAAFAFALFLAAAGWSSPAQAASNATADPTTLLEWTFDRAGDLQGWQPNGHLAGVLVSNGVLACRAVGADPILDLSQRLNLPATPLQQLEVRLKADRDGTAEFFWSNTSVGRFGGLSQEKTTRFNVTGDSQWHTYRLMPFWHPEGKIVRLRFDVYDGAKFEVDFIRITQLPFPSAVERAEFDFTSGVQGWQVATDAALASQAGGVSVSTSSRDGFVLSPPVRFKADENSYVSLRMAVNKGARGTLLFATEQTHGLQHFSFPVEADGKEHTYNLDLLAVSGWRGHVVALGLRPSDAVGAQARLRWLKVSDEAQGPPQVKVLSFGVSDALPRAGTAVTLSVLLGNFGGEPATNLQARLSLPDGVRRLDASTAAARVASLAFGEETELTWRVCSDRPLAAEASLTLTGPNTERLTARAALRFTPRLRIAQTGYVPEPKPVRGPSEVGVYYFPGWNTASRWQPLQRFPERKPVLGWYREGDPEVADWHIKWAVEHGITFFAYDWYWSQGARQLEHGLHDGYFKARYRHLLKFCLLWANHNPPHSSSHEDCLAVTRYWFENYFRRPEHLLIDGQPAVIIFSPDRLTQDLGSAGVKRAFDAMRAECVRAGLKGLHLIACVGDAGSARHAATEGYDAVTAYNWPGLGLSGETKYAPYETLLDGYRRNWEHIVEQSPIPLSPLPICGGWDSRPWHGENNLVRFGRTPELFARHLRDAKAVLGSRPSTLGARPILLIEAWNEWGEGSYIEPHQEFGFGYLDALREVCTDAPPAHDDVTPADAGLGPYEVPRQKTSPAAWSFDASAEGWNHTMNLVDLKAANGALTVRTTGHDPAFFSPPMQARAGDFTAVVLRLKLQRTDGSSFNDTAQLFWRTSRLPESEASSERFAITADGQWHEYKVPVASNRRWRGVITGLRLDPCNAPGAVVDLDFIRLQ